MTKKAFDVFVAKEVLKKDLRRIGPSAALDVLKAINKKLKSDPKGYGEPLHGELAGYYKLSVGQYRVAYKVIEDRVWVLVLAVGKRAEGDFENIWDWLSKEKTQARFLELVKELDGEEKETPAT